MGNLDRCLAVTLREEGGKFHHKKDPGGRTNFGVIQRVYDKYRKSRGLEERTVYEIDKNEVRDIYAKYYWNPLQCDEMPPGIDLAVFDFGVNSGISRSAKYTQRILRKVDKSIKIDGLIGPVTIDALNEVDPDWFINRLKDDRLAFVNRIPYKKYFIKGWTRRIRRVRGDALNFNEAFSTTGPTQPSGQVTIAKGDGTVLPKAEVNKGQPKTSIVRSKSLITSLVVGGASAATAVEQVGSTATTINTSVGTVVGTTESVTKMIDTLGTALQNPIFLLAMVGIIGGTYLWFERKRKMDDLES